MASLDWKATVLTNTDLGGEGQEQNSHRQKGQRPLYSYQKLKQFSKGKKKYFSTCFLPLGYFLCPKIVI